MSNKLYMFLSKIFSFDLLCNFLESNIDQFVWGVCLKLIISGLLSNLYLFFKYFKGKVPSNQRQWKFEVSKNQKTPKNRVPKVPKKWRFWYPNECFWYQKRGPKGPKTPIYHLKKPIYRKVNLWSTGPSKKEKYPENWKKSGSLKETKAKYDSGKSSVRKRVKRWNV